MSLYKVVSIVNLVGILFLVAFGIYASDKSDVLGGVNQSNDYHTTTTASGTAAENYTITAVPGAIGEITVASSSASTFTVLDANGSNTTTIATLKAGINEGTYTLNRSLKYGLIITVPSGFNGQYITTYR